MTALLDLVLRIGALRDLVRPFLARRPFGLVLVQKRLMELFAHDGKFGRSFNSQADSTTGNSNDGNHDGFADANPFSYFAAEYQHGASKSAS